MEIPRKFRGSKFFQRLVPAILKFDSDRGEEGREGDSRILERFATIVSREVSAKGRLFEYTQTNFSNISSPTLAPVCYRCFSVLCNLAPSPPRALYGATGVRYLVFRSSTTADVPQRCCSVFSFLCWRCLQTAEPQPLGKEIAAPPGFSFSIPSVK